MSDVNPPPTVEEVRAIRPRVSRTAYGAWLAVSELGSPIGIGVIGSTESDAREKFALELAVWSELHERALLMDQHHGGVVREDT